MSDCRLVVVSCPNRKPIQELWSICQKANWRDCPYPVDMLSPENDVGWNANLLQYLNSVDATFVLLLLDDHWIDKSNTDATRNMREVQWVMSERPDIGMVKVQAGNAAPPELPFPMWNRLGEYDRAHHPFKRTNLVPTMFRRDWLQRLTVGVLADCGPELDKGRNGALAFEGVGTRMTMDVEAWPERMLGIHRPAPDHSCAGSLLNCISNDGVREGRIQAMDALSAICDVNSMPGIEVFK